MAEPIGRGVLEVGFDPKQIEQAGQQQLLPSAQRVIGDVARVAGAVKLFSVGKEGLDELKQAEAANAQLASVIQSTGNAAGISAEHIDDLSQAALKSAGVDDEAAKKADTLLLQLGKFANTDLGHKNFDRAAEAAVNLSVRMGTDVPAAAQQLAVVLQNPEKGLGRLRRSIGDLSAEQEQSLKHFIAVGDAAGAQAVILDKVDQAVGGAGAAFGDSLPGKIAIAQESLKNMKAELVAGAAPALSLVADVTSAATEKFDELPAGAQTAVGGIVLIGGAATAIARPVGDVLRLIDRFRGSGEAIGEAAAGAAGAGTELNTLAVAADSATGATSAVASSSAELSTDLNTLATGSSAVATKLAAQQASSEALGAAQAEQVLAMRGMDEATIEQVVANEQLVFSDEQVALAQAERLVTNAPLIAAEEALTATETEAAAAAELEALANRQLAASQLGVTESSLTGGSAIGGTAIALTALAVAVPAAIAGYQLIGALTDDNTEGVTEYTQALEGNTEEINRNVAAVTAKKLEDSGVLDITKQAGISVRVLGDAIKSGTDDFGGYDRVLKSVGNQQERGGESAKEAADKLRAAGAGATDFGRALLDSVESGRLTADEADKLVDKTERLHNGYTEATTGARDHKAALDALNPNLAVTSIEAGNAADSTIRLGTSAEGIKAAQESVSNLASSFHDAASQADQAFQAALQLAPADIRAQRGVIAIEADQRKIDEAQAKLDFLRASGADADKIAAAERDLRTAKLDLTDAVLNQAQAQAELAKQQAEANGQTFTAQQFDTTYLGSLQALADMYGGPVRDTLAGYILQTTLATDATIRLRNAQQGNPEFTPEQQALAQQLSGGFTSSGGFAPAGLASGGTAGPGEVFRGAEQGWEFAVLPSEGLYQAPPTGMRVIDHTTSMKIASSGGGRSGITIDTVNVQGADAPSAMRRLPDELRAAAFLAGV